MASAGDNWTVYHVFSLYNILGAFLILEYWPCFSKYWPRFLKLVPLFKILGPLFKILAPAFQNIGPGFQNMRPTFQNIGPAFQNMAPLFQSCHGLYIQSKSRIGHPNRMLDDFIKRPILSRIGRSIHYNLLSRIGCPIQVTDWTSKPRLGLDDFKKRPIPVTDWMSNPWQAWTPVQSQSRFGHPIHGWSGWLSNVWHMYVTDWMVSNAWRTGQT